MAVIRILNNCMLSTIDPEFKVTKIIPADLWMIYYREDSSCMRRNFKIWYRVGRIKSFVYGEKSCVSIVIILLMVTHSRQ